MSTRLQTRMRSNSTPMSSFVSLQSGHLQRKCACGGSTGLNGECVECRNKRLSLQRHSTNGPDSSTVPPIVHEVLHSPGQPLDPVTRAFMELRFGYDFSRVRVHTDVKAAESALAVNAQAYTVGSDVVFGAGQYALETRTGRKLLAHELAHNIQQIGSKAAGSRSLQRKPAQPEEKGETTSEEAEENVELPAFECNPMTITLDKLARLPGAGLRNFGLTKKKKSPGKYDGGLVTKKSCKVKSIKEAKFNLHPFVYVKPGTYQYGTKKIGHPSCPGKKLTVYVEVNSDMAEQFRKGEIEHCEDFRRAFALSWQRYNKALKALQAEGAFAAESTRDCAGKLNTRFKSKLGANFSSKSPISNAEFGKIKNCLQGKTRERDIKGWHSVDVNATSARNVDDRCTKMTHVLDPKHKNMLPELGKHSTNTLVKGCGE